ncbi:amidase signature domain-containing protein [Absidia repens]|uniref:Amidase signature domain-containing protein n=1 Tax=Absidia repens TaxID=90262 RepID=A0A1X2IV31_9FUNG|nr:amidase signature domain-containing protein [Absidia repens]
MTNSKKPFKAPVVYGWPLAVAATAVEWCPPIAYKLAKDAGLFALRDCDTLSDSPTSLAIPESYILCAAKENNAQPTSSKSQGRPPTLAKDTRSQSLFLSFWDYHLAYLEKRATPLAVAKKVLELISQHKQYNWIRSYDKASILEQAEESTKRYQQGNPKSQLDGVFIPVKEELNVAGLETKCGTSFINDGQPAASHARLVQQLHDAGAIIVGHTVMNELGWDTFSVNPVTGTPVNPYENSSSCGGSSGGSAGAVAANLFPIAIGCDGGGSVRIPAAFCGLYGLKTTMGRTSSVGSMPIDSSLAVNGPIAATADDMALAYAIMSGPDDNDPLTMFQPQVSLKDYTLTGTLEGLTIAVVPSWNECVDDPAILAPLDAFITHFKSLGASIVEIEIPDLDLATKAHQITICSEMYSFASQHNKQWTSYLPYTRLMCAVSRCTKIRGRMMRYLERLFRDDKVDLILTPSTGMQAPAIPEQAHTYGISNSNWTTKSMEYTVLGNLTGIPSVSVPSGFHDGKPLGIQLMAEWFNEALLCRMAKVCEMTPGIERRRPDIWCDGSFL